MPVQFALLPVAEEMRRVASARNGTVDHHLEQLMSVCLHDSSFQTRQKTYAESNVSMMLFPPRSALHLCLRDSGFSKLTCVSQARFL